MNTPSLAIVGPSGAGKTTLVQDFAQTDLIQNLKNAKVPISALLQDTSFTQRDRVVYEQQLGAQLSEAYRNCFGCSGNTGLHEFVRLARARAWEYGQQNSLVSDAIESLLVMESYSGKTDTFRSIGDALDAYGVGPRQQSLVAVLSLADEQTVRDQLAFLQATKGQFTELVLTHTDGKNIQTLSRDLPDFGVPIVDALEPGFVTSDEAYMQRLSRDYPTHPKLLQQSPIIIRGEHEKDKIRSASHNYMKLGLSGVEYAEILQLLIAHAPQADRYYVPLPVREDTVDEMMTCDIPLALKEQLPAHVGQFLIVEMGLGMDDIKYSFSPEADRVKIRFGANKDLKNSFNKKYMDPASPSHSRDLCARREVVSDDLLEEKFADILGVFEQKLKSGPYVFNDEDCVLLGELRSYMENGRSHIVGHEEQYDKAKACTLGYIQHVFGDAIDRLSSDYVYTSVDEIGNDIELLVTMVRYRTERADTVSPDQKDFLEQYDLGEMMVGLRDKLIVMIDGIESNNPYLQQPPTIDVGDSQYDPEYVQMVIDSPYSRISQQKKQSFIEHMVQKFSMRGDRGMTYADKHLEGWKKL